MITVTRAGYATSVQDLGRLAYRHLGVGLSGAMDNLALSIANLMLGNPVDAAGLEITLGNASFAFSADTEIALTGACTHATLDGQTLPNWWACSVRAGQTLRLGETQTGVRSYLAVRGGIAAALALGSASTDLKGGFGGHQGRVLKRGDQLPLHDSPPLRRPNPGLGLCPWLLDPYDLASDAEAPTEPVVHILPGPQWADIAAEARHVLTGTAWAVSAQSNRVGCLLEGPEIPLLKRREMRSHGIMPGVVQLPPSGRPMVQLCDGNTSGGYPVIATVLQTDLHRFAQLRPGECVRFSLCDPAQAWTRHQKHEKFLDEIAMRCELARQRFS
ncbi:biotin-dependent carboxyltransferase family protein [Castellaniella sp.]|uniref:5-oxoprolinase subunit C family protein n=1 Tax=Castellaniella sp. TaxID=1955812 RepID=UPI003C77129E